MAGSKSRGLVERWTAADIVRANARIAERGNAVPRGDRHCPAVRSPEVSGQLPAATTRPIAAFLFQNFLRGRMELVRSAGDENVRGTIARNRDLAGAVRGFWMVPSPDPNDRPAFDIGIFFDQVKRQKRQTTGIALSALSCRELKREMPRGPHSSETFKYCG